MKRQNAFRENSGRNLKCPSPASAQLEQGPAGVHFGSCSPAIVRKPLFLTDGGRRPLASQLRAQPIEKAEQCYHFFVPSR